MKPAQFFEVPSETVPGVKYTVIHKADGTWSCSCPQGIFQGRCKHQIKAMTMKKPETVQPALLDTTEPPKEPKRKKTIAEIQAALLEMGRVKSVTH